MADTDTQRGLVIMSALLNFIDWLGTQGVLVTNVPEVEAEQLRGKLVLEFLKSHSESDGYFKQADDIAKRLGEPFIEDKRAENWKEKQSQ
jgi:hypothetical protein